MARRDKRQRERARQQRRVEARVAKLTGTTAQTHASADTTKPICGVEATVIDPGRRWYIARTLPRMGTRALDALKAKQVSTFQPRASEVVVRRGRRVVRHPPLLMRTVFIGLENEHCIRLIGGLPGIAEIVSHPEPDGGPEGNVSNLVMQPARLDPAALQKFADAIALGEIVQPVGVKVGDQVVVREGPFATFPGVVEEILPADKVKVGVAIFGRSSPCVLGIAEIQVVN